MKPIHTFTVVPSLPPALERLRALAGNLRWAWHRETIDLFRGIEPDVWERTGRNPIALLGAVDQSRLEDLAADDGFVAEVDRIGDDLDAYLGEPDTWYAEAHDDGENDDDGDGGVAYFSMEYGITDCVSIFSGGLGMLAGDHLKSASDLGVPLVGVGLFYHGGYFEQRLNEAGWQQEVPAGNDVHVLPLTLERREDGDPLTVELGFPEGPIVAQVWRADVGRVPLYLLDANISANTPEQRRVTHHLYGGDTEMRIRQEILLGIGGLRALEALGHHPDAYHLNEGHSAFLALERVRRLMEAHGLTFAEAREVVAAGLIFTTHTPVEAGHDYFAPDLMARYFQVYSKSLGLDWEDFLGLGRQNPGDAYERFCMTVLALKLSGRANGVSRLHGEVSRAMWQGLWPSVPLDEVPIDHVTNGVHLPSWLSGEMSDLCDRLLGSTWRDEPPPADGTEPPSTSATRAWSALGDVEPRELWDLHEVRRRKLVDIVRDRVRHQRERRGAPPEELSEAEELLDPGALTIGFARRFATYKRATLVLRDRDRLARIFSDPQRPVQLIVAGKAHPLDEGGKELIRSLVEASREEPFRGRIVFVEDYHMALARFLVQGCDVWLNNPVRPREASGTSGMKAAANAVLNLSTLDGWWDEAWNDVAQDGVPFGWAIGRGVVYDDPDRQDDKDAEALYALLEHDVVPTFYDRGDDGVPWSWVARMTESVQVLAPAFTTNRMLREYTDGYYVPAMRRSRELFGGSLARARGLADWRRRVLAAWDAVRCDVAVEEEVDDDGVGIGEELTARAVVDLGDLTPDDVVVELYFGRVGPDGEIHDGEFLAMRPTETVDDGYVYEADDVQPEHSGRYGYTVRVRAHHEDLPGKFVPGCVTWANEP